MALATLICAPLICIGEIVEKGFLAVLGCCCCGCGMEWARAFCLVFRHPMGMAFLLTMVMGLPIGIAGAAVAAVNQTMLCGSPVSVEVWLYVAAAAWLVNIVCGWLLHIRCRRPYDDRHHSFLERNRDFLYHDPWAWLYAVFLLFQLSWAVVGIFVYRSINPVGAEVCGNRDIDLMALIMLWAIWIHLAFHLVIFIGGCFIIEGERLLCCLCAEILCCRPCRRRSKAAAEAKAAAAAAGADSPAGSVNEKEDLSGPTKSANIDVEMGGKPSGDSATNTGAAKGSDVAASSSTATTASSAKAPLMVGNARKVSPAAGASGGVVVAGSTAVSPPGIAVTPTPTASASASAAVVASPAAAGAEAGAAAVNVGPADGAAAGAGAGADGADNNGNSSRTNTGTHSEPGQHPRRHSKVQAQPLVSSQSEAV